MNADDPLRNAMRDVAEAIDCNFAMLTKELSVLRALVCEHQWEASQLFVMKYEEMYPFIGAAERVRAATHGPHLQACTKCGLLRLTPKEEQT